MFICCSHYENLPWVWGWDIKIRPVNHCLALRDFPITHCRVMTNGDSEGRIFLYPTLTQIMDYISCSPLNFYFKMNFAEYAEMQYHMMTSLWQNIKVNWWPCAWVPIQPMNIHKKWCLFIQQEVETDQFYNFFLVELERDGYTGIFSPKSRARTMTEQERKHVDGCAIFFRTTK